MKNIRSRISLLFFPALVLVASSASAQTAPPSVAENDSETNSAKSEPREYVRIRRNERRAAEALETSIIHFGNSKKYPGAKVDLLGAIHLGEADYYRKLNQLFKKYDALLFEAVMPERAVRQGLRPGGARGGRRLNLKDGLTDFKIGMAAIGLFQEGLTDIMGLEFQLAAIDYYAPNFVHADMTQEQFQRAMSRRGESFSEMLAREMAKATLAQQEVNPIAQGLDIFISLVADGRQYRIRRIAAVQLAKAGETDPFAGSDGTSSIITERNFAALKVLKNQLLRGRKHIGIFYGAGHFRHMEKEMIDDFGFEVVSEDWITAWELMAPATDK